MFNSYTEFSPSGKGLHIIVKAKLPGKGRKKGNYEAYSAKRFFTFTGSCSMVTAEIAYRQAELEQFCREMFEPERQQSANKQAELPSSSLHFYKREGVDLHFYEKEGLDRAREAENGAKFSMLFDAAIGKGPDIHHRAKRTWRFERGFIHLRDPKGGIDQTIPMNAEARKILESHERTGSAYVFPGPSGQKRVDIHKTVNRIKDAAGLLRKSSGRFMVSGTFTLPCWPHPGKWTCNTLQKLLTHKSPQMTQRYAHLRDESLRAASEPAGDIIQAATGKKDTTGRGGYPLREGV